MSQKPGTNPPNMPHPPGAGRITVPVKSPHVLSTWRKAHANQLTTPDPTSAAPSGKRQRSPENTDPRPPSGKANPPASTTTAATSKRFTTFLAGVDGTGQLLDAQINWKGKTDRVSVEAPPVVGKPQVHQYVQDTHWSTVESLLAYCEIMAQRRKALKRSAPFCILLDYAPVHTDIKFRKAFYEKYGRDQQGVLIFVPPNTTAKLQALDVCVFKSFKSKYAEAHFKLTHGSGGRFEHTKRDEFLWNTKTSRRAAFLAAQQAWASLDVKDTVKAFFAELLMPRYGAAFDDMMKVFHTDSNERKQRGCRKPKANERLLMFALGAPYEDPLPQGTDERELRIRARDDKLFVTGLDAEMAEDDAAVSSDDDDRDDDRISAWKGH